MIVMPLKIKALRINEPNVRPSPDTPIRHTLSRVSQTGSGLKNLSQQRDLKKIEKHKDSSTEKNSHRELVESLSCLQQQYELMRSANKQNRESIKRSLVSIKCVPKASITLKPRQFTKTIQSQRRSNSLDQTSNSFKVISVGSICRSKKQKKKGISISLMDNAQYKRKIK